MARKTRAAKTATSAPPAGVETLRDLRRAQIVAAARGIVARDGLEALTIGALESRLAYSRGVITYHFREKDEILEAVLASAVAEIDMALREMLGSIEDPRDKVRAVLEGMVRGFVDRVEAVRVLVSFWSRVPSDPRVRRTNARLFAGYREASARLLEEGRSAGAFAGVRPDAFGALLVGIVLGIAAQAYFEEGGIDVEATVEEATRSILARLAGAHARSPRAKP